MVEYVCDVLVPVTVVIEADSAGEAESKALEAVFAPTTIGAKESVWGRIQRLIEDNPEFGFVRSDSDVQVEVGEG